MSDPRAALAEVHTDSATPDAIALEEAQDEIVALAERGVLLVTEERLAAALSDTATGIYATAAEHSAALFVSMLNVDELAALSPDSGHGQGEPE